MATPVLRVAWVRPGHDAQRVLPRYMTTGAAGMDVRAAASCALQPGERKLVPTGLALEIPAGFEVQVRPRSGLAFKHGVTVLNAPGTIDSDYRGEVGVLLINLGSDRVEVAIGDRIAQLVVARVAQARLIEVEALDATSRGEGGFGHTGRG